MGRRGEPFGELDALLEQERRLVAVPTAARTRALARARAALAAQLGGASGAAAATTSGSRPRFNRWLAAACLAFVAGAASGVAAFELGLRARFVPPEIVETPPAWPSTLGRATAPATTLERLAEAEPPLGPRPLARADAARAELRLLRQARAAVFREDFAAALPPLCEHARRFRNGRLAEEREALRVRALAGLGREREAQRAANAFEARFPRSPLVSAVNRISTSGL
jgi:hypothetical protein